MAGLRGLDGKVVLVTGAASGIAAPSPSFTTGQTISVSGGLTMHG